MVKKPCAALGMFRKVRGAKGYLVRVIDEEEVPGKKKGTIQVIPVARNVFDAEMKIAIKKSKHLNYDDWNVINTIINKVADQYEVTFNLKSATHTIRQGADWGCW